MPAAIPEPIKAKVVEMWLQFYSRDAIAKSNYISTGAVSNIVKEWQDKMGKDLALGLRELHGLLKSGGLSVVQCVIGYRIMKTFSDQGVEAETAEHFIADLYKGCKSRGITPNHIVTHIEDLMKFSENVLLPEINEYINEKRAQNKQLDEKRDKVTKSVAFLESKEIELKKSHDVRLEQCRRMEQEVKIFSSSKQVLDQYGISISNDIPKFARTVKRIAEFDYDPEKVVRELEVIHDLKNERWALGISVDEKRKESVELDMRNSSLRKSIEKHAHTLSVLNEMENISFGPVELKKLHDTIIDIMNSNNISYWLAVSKFISDINTQYDTKLGFESEKEKLITGNQILKQKREEGLENITAQPFVGPIIARLLQNGLAEKDILNFAGVFLNILNGSFPVQDLTRGMLKTAEVITDSNMGMAVDAKSMEVLRNVRDELSKLDYS